jgi:hypothetical protein
LVSQVELPDLVIDKNKQDRFYEHFSNLGRYGVKINKALHEEKQKHDAKIKQHMK